MLSRCLSALPTVARRHMDNKSFALRLIPQTYFALSREIFTLQPLSILPQKNGHAIFKQRELKKNHERDSRSNRREIRSRLQIHPSKCIARAKQSGRVARGRAYPRRIFAISIDREVTIIANRVELPRPSPQFRHSRNDTSSRLIFGALSRSIEARREKNFGQTSRATAERRDSYTKFLLPDDRPRDIAGTSARRASAMRTHIVRADLLPCETRRRRRRRR